MKRYLVAALCGALLAFGGLQAQTAGAPADPPWKNAQLVLTATETDVDRSGITGIATHLPDLEKALADAKADEANAAASDTGPIYVLADGAAETLFAMTVVGEAVKKNPKLAGRQIVAIQTPYPAISLYLGSYYNEVGRSQDALRVLDLGLVLFGNRDMAAGTHLPALISERAIALTRLERWTDALAGYDDGIGLEGIENRDRARLYRGRGYVLTELGRLDEAEAAYNESLKLEPGNAIAKGELEYIARLRAGSAREPTSIVIPGKTR